MMSMRSHTAVADPEAFAKVVEVVKAA